jgi:hypothetical protein
LKWQGVLPKYPLFVLQAISGLLVKKLARAKNTTILLVIIDEKLFLKNRHLLIGSLVENG